MGVGRACTTVRVAQCWTIWAVCMVTLRPEALAQTGPSEAVQVSTPDDFQQQVRLGSTHIVITDHLNMTDSPRFLETSVMDTGVISIEQAGDRLTLSIRGNCTDQPTDLETPKITPTQCVITVKEDFLEVPTVGSQLWLSDLYIRIVRPPDVTPPPSGKGQSTLLGVHGGDVYLTGMSFVGDDKRCRAIDMKEDRKLYVSNSYFTGFAKDKEAVLRMPAGAAATFVNTTFEGNEASTDDSEKVAAGPVAGLVLGDGVPSGAAASLWFSSCVFQDNTGLVPGEVGVKDSRSRVYSNTRNLQVWDLDRSSLFQPWLLAPNDAASSSSADAFDGRSFPTEGDRFFATVTAEQADATGMEEKIPVPLPEGTQWLTRDPYPPGDDGFWTTRNIALVVGLGGTFIVILIGVLLWYFCYFKPEGESDQLHMDQKHSEAVASQMSHPSHAPPYGAAGVAPYGQAPATSMHAGPNKSLIMTNPSMQGSMSSRSSAPVPAAYGTPPYGAQPPGAAAPYGSNQMPSGHAFQVPGQYGAAAPYGTTFDRQSSATSERASQQGSVAQAYGTPSVQGAAPYGANPAASPMGGIPAPYGATPAYGERADSNAASSVAQQELMAPQMYGSIPDSGLHPAGSSMVTASELNQSEFNMQPAAAGMQPSGAAAVVEAPLAGGAVEATADDTGIVPPGIHPSWQANPEAPPTKPSVGMGAAGGAAAAAVAAASIAPLGTDATATGGAISEAGTTLPRTHNHQEGVPHTATFTGLAEADPQQPVGMMPLGNTTDARAGPFAAKAASSAPSDVASAAPAVPDHGAEKANGNDNNGNDKEPGEADIAMPPRLPPKRSATYVFDKTVAPDQDISDISHDKVVDMLEDVHAAKALFRSRYELLGAVQQRLGGSGIVQFARTTDSAVAGETEAALKFFIKRAAFDRVAGMFATPSIKSSMGAIVEVVSNNEEEKTGGCVLPACVVMKRGENLEEWALRLRPNLPTSLNALCALADLLKTFHANGHVYYGFKPSNVAWFSEEKKWMLIDFACAARKGLNFALNYAAPEIILAQEAGSRTLAVDPAADIWALGVTAYELLSGGRTFAPGTSTTEIRNMISGRLPLPWEEQEPRQLRTLRHSVLSCLARSPAERPSAADLSSTWRNLLDFAAVKHTEVSG